MRARSILALFLLAAPTRVALAAADLAVTMSAASASVNAGSTITFNVSVQNNGPGSAPNAVLSNPIPANTVFSAVSKPSDWVCATPSVGSTGTISCGISSEPALGGANSFKVTLKVLSSVAGGTVITNTASVSSGTSDPVAGNNSASATANVTTSADVSVTISDAPDPVAVTDEIVYTVVATNAGPSDAAGFFVDVSIPAGTTYASSSCPASACSTITSPFPGLIRYTFTPSRGVPGTSTTLTHTLRVSTSQQTTLACTAAADSTPFDPNNANNSATTTTVVHYRADLRATMSVDPAGSVVAGNTFTSTMSVVNFGPSPAPGLNIVFPYPSETTMVSVTPSTGGDCTLASNGSSCTWGGNTGTGIQRTVTYTARLNPEATPGASKSLSMQTGATSVDPDTTNNSASTSFSVSTSADLSISEGAPSSVLAGRPLRYTLAFQQLGPSSARNVQVSVTLPLSLGLSSVTVVSKPASWTCQANLQPSPGQLPYVVCDAPSPLARTIAYQTFVIEFTVPASTASGTTLNRRVTASSLTSDSNPDNNVSNGSTTVTTSADLSVTVDDTPDPLIGGLEQTYALDVRNDGPSNAANVTLTAPTGTSRTFLSISAPAGWSCASPAVGSAGNVVCTQASLPPGTGRFTMRVRSDAAAPSCAACTHSVNVQSASTPDDNPGNNTAAVVTHITVSADLALSISDSPDPVTAGGSLSYTITATNLGPSTSLQGAGITDPLPAGLTVSLFQSSGPMSCTDVGPTVRCRFNNRIPPGGQQTLTIVTTTAGSLAGSTLTNTATLTHDLADPNSGNETATATTRVNAPTPDRADIALSGSAAPEPVTAGSELTYTLVARNNGPDTASNLAVSATLPAGTTFVSVSGGTCSAPAVGSGGSVSCVFSGNTAKDISRTVTLVVAVGTGVAPGTLLSAAVSGGSDTSDPNPDNNAATVTSTVIAGSPTTADVRVVKTAVPNAGSPLTAVTYTLVVSNGAGGLAAANVALTDPLPAGTAFTSLTAPSGWACTTPAIGAGGTVACTAMSIAPGDAASFTLVVSIGADATGTITNTASVSTATAESSAANNSASASVDVPAPPGSCAGTPPRLLVPIVLDVATATAHFTTELALTNRGGSDAALALRYAPALGERLGAGTVRETLPAGRQLILPDVLAYLRGKGLAIPTGGQQGGPLLVTFEGASSSADVAVTARTTAATTSPQPEGAAGLAYSGLDPCAGTKGRAVLYGLRSSDTDRSNVAVFNPTDEPVSFRVTVISGSGDGASAVVRENDSLPPLGWTQYTRILDGTGIADGICVVETTSDSGAVGAYLVINDNATNDGSFLPALPFGRALTGDRITLPVLVETPVFRSELLLSNRGATTATLSLSYVESLSPQLGTGGTVSFALAPGQQLIEPDAIELLRSRGAGIGAAGAASYAGAVRVTVSGASLADVFVGARTASQSAEGGQFGLFTPGVYQGDEASEQAFVFGVQANGTTRANVAVLNAGSDADGPVTLVLTAVDGDAAGVERGSETLTLAPGRWTQRNGFLRNQGVANGWVRVRRVGGTAPWIAYGVVNDGGNPGERTGDGAFVPMAR